MDHLKGLIVGIATLPLMASIASAQVGCGDCNLDGSISLDDLVRLTRAVLLEAAICGDADVNGDSFVTLEDVLLVVATNGQECAVTPTQLARSTPTPSPSATPPDGDQLPPTEAIALRSWLQEGRYLGWHAESGIHPSGGPHFGRVRTYLNDVAFDSLASGQSQHPKGAAVVKELYFSGSTVREWAVETKLENDSAGGQNWYWYEGLRLAGRGLAACTGCHGSDYLDFKTKDFILTPFPLQ